MSMVEIQDAAARLTETEKAELVLWLLDFLPASSDEDAGHESVTEAWRRREELASGEAQLISDPAFWAGIKEERARWK